jgi:putative DNA primase/helicase
MNLQAVDNQAPERIQESRDINESEFEGGRPHFWTNPEKGLNWETYDRTSGESKRKLVKIGNHLSAIAYIHNLETETKSLYLELLTQYDEIKYITILRSNLSQHQKIFSQLLGCGYQYNLSCQRHLLKYLYSLGSNLSLYTVINKTGWIQDSFIMPHKTYGDKFLHFKTIEKSIDSPFNSQGTLEDWKNSVAIPSSNSSRLIFVIGCAFAAPLLSIFEIEGGGFHFFGETSTGKTTLLKVAASVIGKPSQIIQRWRATSNGLESVAQEHNHLLLPLDEIAQAEPRNIGNIAYMLANGQGKVRSNRNGDATSTKTWKTLFLSTGEVTLADTIAQDGKSIKGGQENRMPDIPACPSSGSGVFESHKGYESSSELVRALEEGTECFYGTPIDAYLTQLVQHINPEWVQSKQDTLKNLSIALKLIAPNDNAVGRVVNRFALIELALLIAEEWNIIHFTTEEIKQSIKTVFEDWLLHRGGIGNIEIKKAVDRIKHLFQSSIHSNRIIHITEGSLVSTGHSKLLAYKMNSELLVPTSVFDNELCIGVNKKDLIKALQDENILKRSTESDRNTIKRQIDGKRKSYYIFNDHFSNDIFQKQYMSDLREQSLQN